MMTVATTAHVALAATLGLMIVSPVRAQSTTGQPWTSSLQTTPPSTAQIPAPPAGSSDAAVRMGALIFAGIGPSKFNNSTAVSGERFGKMSDIGGGVTFAFGGSPVGASVTLRVGGGSGPRLNTGEAHQPPPGVPDAESEFDDFGVVAVSIGAPFNFGRSFFVEPMLDLDSWKIRDTTTLILNNVRSTTTVERSGSDPGVGVRAAWFPSRRVGVGCEWHYVLLHGAAPALASPFGTGGVLENSQALISVYFRWKR